jgi:hypothetical protein
MTGMDGAGSRFRVNSLGSAERKAVQLQPEVAGQIKIKYSEGQYSNK